MANESGAGAQTYDTLIVDGEVVDPGAGVYGELDVAIRDGRIVEVAPGLDRAAAKQVIDATGQIVTPGLVDLHTHVYWGSTYWGIEADPVAARTGVTTWLDVGSSGSYSWPGFRRFIIEPSRSRIFALLEPLLDRADRADLGVRQPRLLRPRAGGDDHRRQPRPHPGREGPHRPEHDARRRHPRRWSWRGSWPTGSICP